MEPIYVEFEAHLNEIRGYGSRASDLTRTRDADTGELSDRTYSYTYDPRDRIAEVTKTNTATGAVLSSESYSYDAASNAIELNQPKIVGV